MLTEGPSRGGRNCGWSSVQSARKYGLKFDGGISMNGNMVEYIQVIERGIALGLRHLRLFLGARLPWLFVLALFLTKDAPAPERREA